MYQDTHLLGFSEEGNIYAFDLSVVRPRIPQRMKLNNIEDIIDMKPMMRDPRHFFLCTTEGLHFLEVTSIRNGILSCKLLPSDTG